MNRCVTVPRDRKRPFWVTQPSACGEGQGECGNPCPSPGLSFIRQGQGATFDTSNLIRGLILNILNTEKRVESSACGVDPYAVKGHWSENFAGGGYRVGTALLNLDTSGMRTNEALAFIQSTLSNDLQKLVTLGVVTSVNVEVLYRGSRRVEATITVEGPSVGPNNRVSLIGESSSDMGYFWSL